VVYTPGGGHRFYEELGPATRNGTPDRAAVAAIFEKHDMSLLRLTSPAPTLNTGSPRVSNRTLTADDSERARLGSAYASCAARSAAPTPVVVRNGDPSHVAEDFCIDDEAAVRSVDVIRMTAIPGKGTSTSGR